jgi:hypothetical protein
MHNKQCMPQAFSTETNHVYGDIMINGQISHINLCQTTYDLPRAFPHTRHRTLTTSPILYTPPNSIEALCATAHQPF